MITLSNVSIKLQTQLTLILRANQTKARKQDQLSIHHPETRHFPFTRTNLQTIHCLATDFLTAPPSEAAAAPRRSHTSDRSLPTPGSTVHRACANPHFPLLYFIRSRESRERSRVIANRRSTRGDVMFNHKHCTSRANSIGSAHY